MTRTIHSGNAGVRGSHINAGPMGEPELAIAAPRVVVRYWCASKHETVVPFAATARVPLRWECSCGQPAGQDRDDPPEPDQFRALRFPTEQKSHIEYVRQRRTQVDGDALLAEALDLLHERRRRDQAPINGVTPQAGDDEIGVTRQVEVSQIGQLAVAPAIHADIAGSIAMGTVPAIPSPPSSA